MTIPILSALFIVLTSPYPQNPASAIGHVFLLEADSLKPYPLWNTVGYMADIGDANRFMYIKKGIFGGFPASYEILPFYEKIEQYSDTENRDLWLYPLQIFDEELKRFRDTLSVWASKEHPYKFFTLNCVDGIYNILSKTLDSIPEPYSILTPQNFIELLHKSDRIGKPMHFHAGDSISKTPAKYSIPHRYGRLDLGTSLGFRLLLHSLKDRSLFFTPFMEFEALSLGMKFNRNSLKIKEFWFMKILSIFPQEQISWMLNIGQVPQNIDAGIGQSYEVNSSIYGGFLFRNSVIQRNDKLRYLAGLRIFLGSYSFRAWRWGMHGEYLYDYLKLSEELSVNSWLSFDISQNFSLFSEAKWKRKKEGAIDVMAAFYF
jgi:hypothetical protein